LKSEAVGSIIKAGQWVMYWATILAYKWTSLFTCIGPHVYIIGPRSEHI